MAVTKANLFLSLCVSFVVQWACSTNTMQSHTVRDTRETSFDFEHYYIRDLMNILFYEVMCLNLSHDEVMFFDCVEAISAVKADS